MKIIKLGGSLLSDVTTLTQCLSTIKQQYNDNIVIVPGGGVFADQVRKLQKQYQFNDETAHHLAILAMQQTALILKSIQADFLIADSVAAIQRAVKSRTIIIWSPEIAELNASAIKASWNITSDSLAAWLATQLSATELILIKSAEIPVKLDDLKMQQLGLVDQAFSVFTKHADYKITLINKQHFNDHSCT